MLHIFLSNRPGDVKYGTTGKPIPGYALKLVGDDGLPVKKGELGELLVSGPTSAIMYWNNREQSRKTFLGEWTRSGDKYLEDEDGYFVYCGRNDDMLKVSGLYVSPFEVEGALQTHAEVLECAVVAWCDGDGLTKPKAFVVLKTHENAGDSLSRALQDHVKASSHPINTRAGSSFAGSCRRRRPEKSSASNCAPRVRRAKVPSNHQPGGLKFMTKTLLAAGVAACAVLALAAAPALTPTQRPSSSASSAGGLVATIGNDMRNSFEFVSIISAAASRRPAGRSHLAAMMISSVF